jgi:hypothetical protein
MAEPRTSRIDPTGYATHFASSYMSAPYFRQGREWRDYEPAYRYGYDSYHRAGGRDFDEMHDDLERGWNNFRRESRLTWEEAKEAVRDGWHYIERALPGDADRDGR